MSATDLFTLTDLSLEVAQILGDTSDIGIAKAKKFINRALIRVSEIGDFPFLVIEGASFATVASTETYGLAVGVKRILAVYVTGNSARKFTLMNNRDFRERFPNVSSSVGTPYFYRYTKTDTTTGQRYVGLYPIPSAVETIYYDYIKEMVLLTNNTDDVRIVSGLPDYMVDALIELAAAIGMREQDDENYEGAMAEAIARWNNLYLENNSEIDDRIRARPSDGQSLDYLDPKLPSNYGG